MMSVSNQNVKRKENFFKIRKIKITQSSDRGNLFTEKNLNDGYIQFESLLEEGLYKLLIHDPHCVDMESQPVKIERKNSKRTPYIPDAWAKFIDGTQVIFDAKHQDFLDSLKDDLEKKMNWEERVKIVEEFCKKNGLLYEIVTDKEIWNQRYENVEFFEREKEIPEKYPKIKPILDEILSKYEKLSRIELAIELSKELQLNLNEAIQTIDYLIYHDYFLLDFETKITDNTLLKRKLNQKSKITPLYQYINSIKKRNLTKKKQDSLTFSISPSDPNYNSISQREFLALSESVQKEVLNRIDMLKIFDSDDFSTERLKAYAKDKKVGVASLYRWEKKYEQSGWSGLIPNYEKSGRKRDLGQKIEDLMQKIIEETYLVETQPSIKSSYRFFVIECKKLGISPIPHYDTFRRRIYNISNKKRTLMRRGRKLARDKYKLLNGFYPFGKYPLACVEFDHTLLDITLVDRIDRQPIGRPWLTVAIDVYTRMIYGFYLSFDQPNVLSVGICFLTGILPKDKITDYFKTDNKWLIQGLPKNILIDNAKEFRSRAFFNFCKRYGITQKFNPVHRPDLKPHVERVLRTINQALRDDLIKGYVLPLLEKRATQYDQEKKAELAIEELEAWLIHWIVDEYHMRIHSGIKKIDGIEITPFERYKQGFANSEGRTVGSPRVPLDWEQLRYDLLPFETRKLHREGVKLFNLVYNAPIISKIRAIKDLENRDFIVKYDPRDIREVYLWVDSLKEYKTLKIRNAYYSQLEIDPDNQLNYPLSLKEFELIKKNWAKHKKSRITQYDLDKAMENRQKIIEEARKKKKSAKKARKRQEKIDFQKRKSTSTKIRAENKERGKKEKDIKEFEEEYVPTVVFSKEQQASSDEDLKEYKPKLYPVSFWEEKNYEEEEDENE